MTGTQQPPALPVFPQRDADDASYGIRVVRTAWPRFRFLGAEIDALTMEETLERVERIIHQRKPVQHVVVNVAKLVAMRRDAGLRRIVNGCPLINADGAGIVFGARVMGIPVPERVAGIDLMERLLERSAVKGYSVYLLGARQPVLDRVLACYRERYPALRVAWARNGYFTDAEEAEVVGAIRDSGADILLVAMSSPKKEEFIGRNLEAMGVPFAMGVGGSFDVVAGHVRRAPRWMQKAGLEWFHRLASEPRRMWRRYLVTNTLFAWMLLRAVMSPQREEWA